MADKELRIKYILDKSQFDAGIKAANQGLKDTGKHLDDGTQSALSMTKALAGMVGVQTGMAAVGQVVSAISSSMQDAAEYTRRVAEAFGATRDSMREIAAIAGKGLTNEFVQSQLDVAKKAQIVTSGEYTKGVEAFQQYGSNYIGEGANKRITQGQLDELLPDVMAASKVQGVDQGAAMTVFAKIVQALPAHSKTSDYKDTFAKILQMSKDSSGSATLTARNLAPIMASFIGDGNTFAPTMEGISDATKMTAVVSEAHAEEAMSYTRAGIQQVDMLDIKGKDAEYGISEDMTFMQKVEAIEKKWVAETGGKGDFKKWFRKKLGGRMGSIQGIEAIGLWVQKGIEQKVFASLEEGAKDASGAQLDAAKAAHLETAGGKADAATAFEDISAKEAGIEYADVETMKTRARGELNVSGAFKQGHAFTTFMNNALPGGAKNADEALINERALRDAQADAARAGVNAYYGPDAMIGGLMGSHNMSDQGMKEEIKRLVDLTAQANAQRARQVPAVPAPMNGKPNVAAQMPR
jgi:hypothetical protein